MLAFTFILVRKTTTFDYSWERFRWYMTTVRVASAAAVCVLISQAMLVEEILTAAISQLTLSINPSLVAEQRTISLSTLALSFHGSASRHDTNHLIIESCSSGLHFLVHSRKKPTCINAEFIHQHSVLYLPLHTA
jgi:hypothetical protein